MWIKTSDKLPEKEKDVLTYSQKYGMAVLYQEPIGTETWWFVGGNINGHDADRTEDPTFWMELPEAP